MKEVINMENRKYIRPQTGRTYDHKNGEKFKCMGYERNIPIMQNINTGWTMRCHGVGEYENGNIDWDYSGGGHFEETESGIAY